VVRDIKGRIRTWNYTTTSSGASVTVGGKVDYDDQDRLAAEYASHVPGAVVEYQFYGPNETTGDASPGALKAIIVKRDGVALYTTTYKYDPNTRRVYSIEAGGKTFTYGYIDNSSAVKSIDSAGKVTATRHYDSAGRMDSLVQDKDDGAGGRQTLFGVSYGFNAIDQRNSATVTALNPSGQAADYQWIYDFDASNADQLKTANLTIGGIAVSEQQHTYTFDGAGKRLLADIEAGKVDCVVVYKVDRLSRSLLDFSRIMQVAQCAGGADRGIRGGAGAKGGKGPRPAGCHLAKDEGSARKRSGGGEGGIKGHRARSRSGQRSHPQSGDRAGCGDRLVEFNATLETAQQKLTLAKERIAAIQAKAIDREEVSAALASFVPVWEQLSPREQERVVRLLVERVEYDGKAGEVAITFRPAGIKTLAIEAGHEVKS